MNYYAVLGVAEDATPEAIHNAFRTLARQFHPDAGEGSSAGKFREIAEAYETLSDPARRNAYDAALARQRRPATPQQHAPPRIVVEPLAQPWFAARAQPAYARPIHIEPMASSADLFDQLFQTFEDFFSDPWFYSR